MKILRNLTLLGTTVALSNCGVMDKINQPISDDGFNPLDKPGSYKSKNKFVRTGSRGNSSSAAHGFKSGDVVEVAIANTAFFNRVPKSGDRYSKVLKVGETLKVLGSEKDFLKVSTSKGKVGYVSSVMVISKGAGLSSAPIPMPSSDIAPEPEIKGISSPKKVPRAPKPVPSITEPVQVDPEPIPKIPSIPSVPKPVPAPKLQLEPAPAVPDPLPVPSVPEIPKLPEPVPSVPVPITPIAPSLPGGGAAPEPEIPGLPEL